MPHKTPIDAHDSIAMEDDVLQKAEAHVGRLLVSRLQINAPSCTTRRKRPGMVAGVQATSVVKEPRPRPRRSPEADALTGQPVELPRRRVEQARPSLCSQIGGKLSQVP